MRERMQGAEHSVWNKSGIQQMPAPRTVGQWEAQGYIAGK